MTDKFEAEGNCLCGAVQFKASAVNSQFGACHCGMCRRWGGGPLMAVDCGSDISFTGEENITVYDSSDWAQRGFCNKCGSHLFYRLKQNQQHMIPVGLFNGQLPFTFSHQLFIDRKPPYYRFCNDTQNMTEEEIFALYAPKD